MTKVQLEEKLFTAITMMTTDATMFDHTYEEALNQTLDMLGITMKQFDTLRHN